MTLIGILPRQFPMFVGKMQLDQNGSFVRCGCYNELVGCCMGGIKTIATFDLNVHCIDGRSRDDRRKFMAKCCNDVVGKLILVVVVG